MRCVSGHGEPEVACHDRELVLVVNPTQIFGAQVHHLAVALQQAGRLGVGQAGGGAADRDVDVDLLLLDHPQQGVGVVGGVDVGHDVEGVDGAGEPVRRSSR